MQSGKNKKKKNNPSTSNNQNHQADNKQLHANEAQVQQFKDDLKEQVSDAYNPNINHALQNPPVQYANVQTKKVQQKQSNQNDKGLQSIGISTLDLVNDGITDSTDSSLVFQHNPEPVLDLIDQISLPIAQQFNYEKMNMPQSDIFNLFQAHGLSLIAHQIIRSVDKDVVNKTRFSRMHLNTKTVKQFSDYAHLYGEIPMKNGKIHMKNPIHMARVYSHMACQLISGISNRTREVYKLRRIGQNNQIHDFGQHIHFSAHENYDMVDEHVKHIYDSELHEHNNHPVHFVPFAEPSSDQILEFDYNSPYPQSFPATFKAYHADKAAALRNQALAAVLRVETVTTRDAHYVEQLRRISMAFDQLIRQSEGDLVLIDWKPTGEGKFAQLYCKRYEDELYGKSNQGVVLSKQDVAIGKMFLNTVDVQRIGAYGEISMKNTLQQIIKLETRYVKRSKIT